SIISKRETLSPDEKDIVRMHTVIGRNMLQASANPYFETACAISMMHHERFNGSGYPLALSGDAIPVVGRIAGLADVFDALTSTRPYKQSWSFEKAFCFLTENNEMNFDPEIVSVFAEKADGIREVFTMLAD
ncbi:MAG: two-component system response regulator, partial [Nitrospirae bacterium]|nr:two-component system response regulator [Nitrospirota bacterium]